MINPANETGQTAVQSAQGVGLVHRSTRIKWIGGLVLGLLALGLVILLRVAQRPSVSGVQINVATFCDSATDDNGKLTVQGTFDTIFSPTFPAIHPRCSIAVRLMFAADQLGRQPARIRLVDNSGLPIMGDVHAQFEPTAMHDGSPMAARNLIVNIIELRLPAAGTYYAELWLRDRLLTRLPLIAHVRATTDIKPPNPTNLVAPKL